MTNGHRTTVTLVTAAILIGVIGYVRPEFDKRKWSDEQSTSMFAKKLTWGPEFDLVILGDSRVVFGVSPDVIDHAVSIDGHKTGNFGFLGATLREDYVDWAVQLLRPPLANRPRTLLIGVTPRALVPTVTWSDQFSESAALGFVGRRLQADVKPLLTPFRRTTFSDIRDYLRPRPTEKLPVEFEWFENGSVAATRKEAGSSDGNLIKPPDEPVAPFEPTTQTALLYRVRTWTNQGIHVFAFRPPVPDAMARQEDRVYRFDEPAFVAEFTAAGGRWLEIDLAHLDCWDGSHLAWSTALELSHGITERITHTRN